MSVKINNQVEGYTRRKIIISKDSGKGPNPAIKKHAKVYMLTQDWLLFWILTDGCRNSLKTDSTVTPLRYFNCL